MRGAFPKRGADDVIYAIGLRIEHAAECGKPLFGLSVDFMKCFIAVWVRAVGALTTPDQAMAYLDDIHAMSESLRGLKAVAEVTTDFANATDGGVNAGKSFLYATNADAPGTLTVQGNKVLRKTSFDVLGAMFTVGKGAPPPSRRIQTRFGPRRTSRERREACRSRWIRRKGT
ncbi:hypothetical protein DIPPA_07690 [Diplonema papillatum]|nr:hypothetical protein DIPPA_07690 [Diplonema papillatum]